MQQNPEPLDDDTEVAKILRETRDNFSYDTIKGVNPGRNMAGIVYLLMENYAQFREDLEMIRFLNDHRELSEWDEMGMNSVLRHFKRQYFGSEEEE